MTGTSLPPMVLAKGSAEQVLITAVISGNEKSISQLYKMYAPALMGIIIKIVKVQTTAEDVLQETFIKIWKSAEQYQESKGRLFTWMSRIARNTAIDMLRSKEEIRCEQNVDLDEVVRILDNQTHFRYNIETIGLVKLTDQLTRSQKTILELIYFQGYSQSETAEKLNIPLGTIKTRIRLAILCLRKIFDYNTA